MFKSLNFLLLIATALLAPLVSAEGSKVNPSYTYFSKGDTPENWQWVLSDPSNWWMPLGGNEGQSGSKRLTMGAAGDSQFPGAIKLVWSKKGSWAGASIVGRTIDLSAVADKAELQIVVRVDGNIAKDVSVKMNCGENCQAEIPIGSNLKKIKPKQWAVLPIALDCFVAQGADLSKINVPFAIGTTGKMTLEIADISVRAMVAGDEGCVPNEPAPGGN